MAYNNYTPMYQSYYQYPQQYQQPQYQQVQQPVQQQSNSAILWVRNANEAAMYPVSPNNAVVLWDSGSPVIYLKQADASGKPSMKTFDLVERAEPVPEKEAQDYATKAELGALAGVVRDIDGVIASLRKEVDEMIKRPKEEDDGKSDL